MTETSEDWREKWVVPTIMISLAGRAAEARARRPDRDGFRRLMDITERVAIHEAAHLVVAVAVGQCQNGAAIEKFDNGCRGLAQHYQATAPEGVADHPTFETFDELERDFQKATAIAKLAVGHGWLRYLRELWLRTDGILAQHWLAVKMLAMELHRTETVRRDRAQELLDRWMPVKGESLFEVLAKTQRLQSVSPTVDSDEIATGRFDPSVPVVK